MVRPVSCFVISTNSKKNTQLIFKAILATRNHYPFNPTLALCFSAALPLSLSLSLSSSVFSTRIACCPFFVILIVICHASILLTSPVPCTMCSTIFKTPQPRPQPNCPASPLRKSHPLHQQKKIINSSTSVNTIYLLPYLSVYCIVWNDL